MILDYEEKIVSLLRDLSPPKTPDMDIDKRAVTPEIIIRAIKLEKKRESSSSSSSSSSSDSESEDSNDETKEYEISGIEIASPCIGAMYIYKRIKIYEFSLS